jgi:hypothetical protein
VVVHSPVRARQNCLERRIRITMALSVLGGHPSAVAM